MLLRETGLGLLVVVSGRAPVLLKNVSLPNNFYCCLLLLLHYFSLTYEWSCCSSDSDPFTWVPVNHIVMHGDTIPRLPFCCFLSPMTLSFVPPQLSTVWVISWGRKYSQHLCFSIPKPDHSFYLSNLLSQLSVLSYVIEHWLWTTPPSFCSPALSSFIVSHFKLRFCALWLHHSIF